MPSFSVQSYLDKSFQDGLEDALADQTLFAPQIREAYNNVLSGFIKSAVTTFTEKYETADTDDSKDKYAFDNIEFKEFTIAIRTFFNVFILVRIILIIGFVLGRKWFSNPRRTSKRLILIPQLLLPLPCGQKFCKRTI